MTLVTSAGWSDLVKRQSRRDFRSSSGSGAKRSAAKTYTSDESSYRKYTRTHAPLTSAATAHSYRKAPSTRSASVDRHVERHYQRGLRETDDYFRRIYPGDAGFVDTEDDVQSHYVVLHGQGATGDPDWKTASDVTVTSHRPRYTDVIRQQRARREHEERYTPHTSSYDSHQAKRASESYIRALLRAEQGEGGEYSGIDYRTTVDGIPKKYRPSDDYIRREHLECYAEPNTRAMVREQEALARGRSRAASISRFHSDIEESFETRRSRRSSSLARHDTTRYTDYSDISYRADGRLAPYRQGDTLRDFDYVRRQGSDISSYVLPADAKFEPNEVKVMTLPSGQTARTYTQTNQYGRGDQKFANTEIEHVIQKTKFMQDSMHTLENFVRRNRNLFPEDTTVYQHIRFFQLSEAQLRELGEPTDAVVYGVKIREKLVVPVGTDINEALKGFYGRRGDIEVEYSDGRRAPTTITTEEDETLHYRSPRKQAVMLERDDDETVHYRSPRKKAILLERDEEKEEEERRMSIRRQVELEFEERDKARVLGKADFRTKTADQHTDRRDRYGHMTQHLTPEYMRSIYVNAGLEVPPRAITLPDDDIVETEPRSRRVVAEGRARQRRPQIITPLKHKRVTEGNSARFTCAVIGEPLPQGLWYHQNVLLSDSDKYKISNKHGLMCLEILNCEPRDAGVYTIKITNTEGEEAESAPLEVDAVSVSSRPTGESAPYFSREPVGSSLREGDKLVLEVQATGRPVPTMQWFRDNIPLSDNHRTRIFSDEYGHSRLIISNLQPGDTGLYQCLATNKVARVKAAASVKVHELPHDLKVTPDQAVHDRAVSPTLLPASEAYLSRLAPLLPAADGTAPWFIQTLPAVLSVHQGEPLKLNCIVDGEPKPVVTWLKEPYRELQYSQRHRVVVDKDHHLMEIQACQPTDAGRFMVTASNSCGRIQATCLVHVLPPREMDDDDFEVRQSLIRLPDYRYDVEFETEQGRMAPKFIKKLPFENEITEGGTLEVECHVNEVDMPDVVRGVKVNERLVREGEIKTFHVTSAGVSQEVTKYGRPEGAITAGQRPEEHVEGIPAYGRPAGVPESAGVADSAGRTQQEAEVVENKEATDIRLTGLTRSVAGIEPPARIHGEPPADRPEVAGAPKGQAAPVAADVISAEQAATAAHAPPAPGDQPAPTPKTTAPKAPADVSTPAESAEVATPPASQPPADQVDTHMPDETIVPDEKPVAKIKVIQTKPREPADETAEEPDLPGVTPEEAVKAAAPREDKPAVEEDVIEASVSDRPKLAPRPKAEEQPEEVESEGEEVAAPETGKEVAKEEEVAPVTEEPVRASVRHRTQKPQPTERRKAERKLSVASISSVSEEGKQPGSPEAKDDLEERKSTGSPDAKEVQEAVVEALDVRKTELAPPTGLKDVETLEKTVAGIRKPGDADMETPESLGNVEALEKTVAGIPVKGKVEMEPPEGLKDVEALEKTVAGIEKDAGKVDDKAVKVEKAEVKEKVKKEEKEQEKEPESEEESSVTEVTEESSEEESESEEEEEPKKEEKVEEAKEVKVQEAASSEQAEETANVTITITSDQSEVQEVETKTTELQVETQGREASVEVSEADSWTEYTESTGGEDASSEMSDSSVDTEAEEALEAKAAELAEAKLEAVTAEVAESKVEVKQAAVDEDKVEATVAEAVESKVEATVTEAVESKVEATVTEAVESKLEAKAAELAENIMTVAKEEQALQQTTAGSQLQGEDAMGVSISRSTKVSRMVEVDAKGQETVKEIRRVTVTIMQNGEVKLVREFELKEGEDESSIDIEKLLAELGISAQLAEGNIAVPQFEQGPASGVSVSRATKVTRMVEVDAKGQETVKEIRKVTVTIMQNGEVKLVREFELKDGEDESSIDIQNLMAELGISASIEEGQVVPTELVPVQAAIPAPSLDMGDGRGIAVSKVTRVMRSVEVNEKGEEKVKEIRKVLVTVKENGEVKIEKEFELQDGQDESSIDIQKLLSEVGITGELQQVGEPAMIPVPSDSSTEGKEISVSKKTQTTRTIEIDADGKEHVKEVKKVVCTIMEDGQVKEVKEITLGEGEDESSIDLEAIMGKSADDLMSVKKVTKVTKTSEVTDDSGVKRHTKVTTRVEEDGVVKETVEEGSSEESASEEESEEAASDATQSTAEKKEKKKEEEKGESEAAEVSKGDEESSSEESDESSAEETEDSEEDSDSE